MTSDNGLQFVAREFKQFIRRSGMDHVRTSASYPQSNGEIERRHGLPKRRDPTEDVAESMRAG